MAFPSISTVISIAVAGGLLLATSRRPWTTSGLVAYLLGFVLLSSFIKQAHIGMAMTLADIHFFLLRPVENFKLFVTYPVLGLTLIGVVAGLLAVIGVGLRFERPRLGGRVRLLTGSAALALGAGALLAGGPESQARAGESAAYAAFLTMYEQKNPGGWIGRINVFFNNRTFTATLPPEQKQSRFVAAPSAETSGQRPDILLVLEESTFDTRLLRDCPAEACAPEMLNPLESATRTRQGPLLVHTTGGGTWLAEFAILAGLDWRVFGRGGAYAPVSLAPRLKHSLALHLRSLGYRTVAIYPTDGNFLSAQTAYDDYGFEEFHERRQLGLPDEWGDARDGLVFEKALSLAQRPGDDRPLFMFVLTIRNHGPHGYHPETIPADLRTAADRTSLPMGDFLGRMRDSSEDLVMLASRWLSGTRPRVLAWFGDHQPEAAWDFTADLKSLDAGRVAKNVPKEQSQYLTYFQLSANFGSRGEVINQDALDIAYLGADLLEFAGVPLDPGSLAARQTMLACNGLMIDCPDRALLGDYLSYRIHELGTIE